MVATLPSLNTPTVTAKMLEMKLGQVLFENIALNSPIHLTLS